MFPSQTKRDIGKPSGMTPPAKKTTSQSPTGVLPNTPAWPGTFSEITENINTTPLQEGGESSESGASGLDSNSSLMDFLKEESKKRDEQHRQLVGSMDTLRNTVVDLKNSIDVEKKTREKEIADVKAQIAGIEQRDKDIIEEMVNKHFANPMTNMSGSDNDQVREKQVIVSGFEECDEQTIIKELEQTLTTRQLYHRVSSVFTFVDPSKIAVMEFETVAAKRGFFKKLQSSKLSGAIRICHFSVQLY